MGYNSLPKEMCDRSYLQCLRTLFHQSDRNLFKGIWAKGNRSDK